MNRTPARADIAHYDPRLASLSTRPASHGCSNVHTPGPGHHFNGAIESLTWDGQDNHDPHTAAITSAARRDSVRDNHDGRDGAGGIANRDFPAEPEPEISRPSTAPAYPSSGVANPATFAISSPIITAEACASRRHAAVTFGDRCGHLRAVIQGPRPMVVASAGSLAGGVALWFDNAHGARPGPPSQGAPR